MRAGFQPPIQSPSSGEPRLRVPRRLRNRILRSAWSRVLAQRRVQALAEGSGAGLAAGRGAAATAAGSPGPGRFPAEAGPDTLGRISSALLTRAAGAL